MFPVQGAFGDLIKHAKTVKFHRNDWFLEKKSVESTIDGIVMDVGFGSDQIDPKDLRGFSYRHDAPLDMRFTHRTTLAESQTLSELLDAKEMTAAKAVNLLNVDQLYDIFSAYSEDLNSGLIAEKIVEKRSNKPIHTTFDLVRTVRSAIGKVVFSHHEQMRTVARIFQGLRIFVNDELGELNRALTASEKLLVPDGRLCIITFHSLEDAIIKKFFRHRTKLEKPTFVFLDQTAMHPSKREKLNNSRAKSALLRVAYRTHHSLGKQDTT